MALTLLSEKAVRIAVLAFSISGLVILSIIAGLTEVERIHLWEVGEHEGERVKVEGVVVGTTPSRSGSAWVFLMEDNTTMRIFVENGKGDLDPGALVEIDGEVTVIDGDPAITVQNDDDILTKKKTEAGPYEGGAVRGDVLYVPGIVRSCSLIGFDEVELTLMPLYGTEAEVLPLLIDLLEPGTDLRPGDLINITALFMDDRCALAFGERCFEIIARAETRTTSLLRLVEDMRISPSGASYAPFTLDGYLRYPGGGRTLYISEMAEGGEISIRCRLPTARADLEKGDLVRLFNCSLSWDSEGMRFELAAEDLMVLEKHGPWRLNLGSMPGGLLDYLDCRVDVSGTAEETLGSIYLTDGGCSLELMNYTGPLGRSDTEVSGILLFDAERNTIYLRTEAALP
ncbi:MAG: hypothetical protein ACMUHU_01595 [Thermoplasmatota archaeon]